jgi:PhnB protein
MKVTPYLMLYGRGAEAIEFYKKAVGATAGMVMQFKDAPDKSMITPGSENQVMHAAITIGDSTIMLSDGCPDGETAGYKGISLTINADNEAHADKLFAALSEGGKVQMPMEKTFFAKKFGVVSDKFGIGWMIIAE